MGVVLELGETLRTVAVDTDECCAWARRNITYCGCCRHRWMLCLSSAKHYVLWLL